MFKHAKEFAKIWIDSTCPSLGEYLRKVKQDLSKIYQDARQDYEEKKRVRENGENSTK